MAKLALCKQGKFLFHKIPDSFSLTWTVCVVHFSADDFVNVSQCHSDMLLQDGALK